MSDKFPVPFTHIGEFELLELIQESQAALSFRAFQKSLQQDVFLKILKPHVQNQREWVLRFQREARACARLKHPHIVQVYTLGEEHGCHYMAMEYVEGESLRQILEREEVLSEADAIKIGRQVLEALQYAHQHKIIHRDVKPGNILVSGQGWVKLTDFGLAHLGEDAEVTQQGALLGTPAYMAPEQILGEQISAETDIFSLGITLYEMLSGHKPFAGNSYSECIHKILNVQPEPLHQINPKVSQNLSAIIQRAYEKKPKERYSSAGEFLEALNSYEKQELQLGGLEPAGKNSEKKEDYIPKKTKRNSRKQKSVLLGLIGALLAVMIILYFLESGRPPQGNKKEAISTGQAVKDDSISGNQDQSKPAMEDSFKEILTTAEQPEAPRFTTEETEKSLSTEKKEAKQPVRDTLSREAETELGENEKDSVQVVVNVTPWAKFLVDGIEVDSMLRVKSLWLPAGEHEFTFIHPNFKPRVIKKMISEKNKAVHLSFSFLQTAAYLWVDVRPWADIYLNKKRIDTTPLKKPLALEPGEYLLELKHPNFLVQREIISVHQGDTLRIFKTLTN
ncbi:MAG: hypothetical protein Kow0037_01930 [Calditrichia bacterium]